jgi:hypothetical protein
VAGDIQCHSGLEHSRLGGLRGADLRGHVQDDRSAQVVPPWFGPAVSGRQVDGDVGAHVFERARLMLVRGRQADVVQHAPDNLFAARRS